MPTDRDGHRYFEGMAVAHVVGGLDEADGRMFRSHLLECSECRARVGELRALAHDLADVERDERRVRTPAALETKDRDLEEAEQAEPEAGAEPAEPTPPRIPSWLPKVVAVLGLVALIGLAGWNFMLRGTVANLEAAVDSLTEASALLQFGQQAAVTYKRAGVDATISTDGQQLALLVDGVPTGESFQIFLLDERGHVVDSDRPVEARNERLFVLVPDIGDAHRVVVSPAPNGPTSQPQGEVVRATLP